MYFRNRREAGKILAKELTSKFTPLEISRRDTPFLTGFTDLKNPIVLGIPRGGIAVGYSVAETLKCPLEAVSLRKLPVPNDPEAGFGAVSLNKKVILNEPLLSRLHLNKEKIKRVINNVYKEVLRRDRLYRGNEKFPSLKGRSVIITDDGLATGYTMLSAVEFARDEGPLSIIVAVPVSHSEAFNLVKTRVDKMVCLHIDYGYSFAVASFYIDFPDMKDEEVIELLNKIRTFLQEVS